MSRVDQGFLRSVLLSQKSYLFAIEQNIESSHLRGEYGAGWQFVQNHFDQYKKLPDEKTLRQMTGVIIDDEGPSEPVEYWIREIQNRFLHEQVGSKLDKVVDALERKDGFSASEHIETIAQSLAKTGIGSARKVESIISLGDEVIRGYEEAKRGLTGVPTPWPSLNDMTQGWQPQDFILWAARPGVGKTWSLLLNALVAWQAGKKVLLISTEMSRKALARRFFSLFLRVPYRKIRRGELDTMSERRFYERINQCMTNDDERLSIVGDSFDFTLGSVRAAIVEKEPDVVFIDGLYLIKIPGKKERTEHMAVLSDEAKKLAKDFNVPVQASTQLNRSLFKGGKHDVGLHNLGLSDNLGWVADAVFFLVRDKDLISDKKIAIHPVKLRESDSSDDIISWWNFDGMFFAEVDREAESAEYRPDLTAAEAQRLAAATVSDVDNDFDDIPFEIESSTMNDTVDPDLGF